MKTLSVLLTALLMVSLPAVGSQAALIDRGNNLIYDTVLDVTWLNMDSGQMSWSEAAAWADALVYDDPGRGVSWDDWRLPYFDGELGLSTPDEMHGQYLGSIGLDCMKCHPDKFSPPLPPITTPNEMLQLFSDELGGTEGVSILMSQDPDLALFSALQSGKYWTAHTEAETGANGLPAAPDAYAIVFNFGTGHQRLEFTSDAYSILAVRDGDVAAVPEPASLLLVASGLTGMIGLKRRRKK